MANVVSPLMIDTIWSSTNPGRSIRKVVVDFYCEYAAPDYMVPNIITYHPEFRQDLLVRMIESNQRRARGLYSGKSFCHYHEHDENNVYCPPQASPVPGSGDMFRCARGYGGGRTYSDGFPSV